MRKFVALFLIVLLLFSARTAVFATDVNETVYTTTAVNVRTGPGMDYTILDCLRPGQSVRRVGIGDDGWSKVIYNGREAYMFSAYLTTTNPNGPEANVDYSRLTRQVAIANGLNQSEYTADSWKGLSDALAAANNTLSGGDQKKVDECVQALSDAISSLVKMDYSALSQALAAVREFVGSDAQNGLWLDLAAATDEGEARMGSGDQAAVDAAAARINEILAAIKADMEDQTPPEVIIQEVYVEVPPTDDYCNVGVHHVWPVVFIVSLVLNLVMGALIVVYVSRKRKIQTDDIPLVDYEIGDDLI